MKRSKQLRDQAAALQRQAEEIRNAASGRALTADEMSRINDTLNQVEDLIGQANQAEIEERLDAASGVLNAALPRQVPPARGNAPAAGGTPHGQGARATHNSTLDERAWGFTHQGEYYTAVRNAYIGRGVDDRLIHNAATTFGSEGIGPDGGYAVPPDYRTGIEMLINGENSMLGMTDQQQTSSNQIVVPVDENAPWHSSGVRTFWVDEAGATTQTKPNLQPLTVRANKLMGLVYLTDELLSDAASMGAYVQSKAPSSMNWEINKAIVNGDGNGKPLGLLTAPAKVAVAKEGSQANGTILAVNVLKMWARLFPESQQRAVWLYNVDVLPQLAQMNIAFNNAAGSAGIAAGRDVFMPPGGLSQTGYATLMGRPMMPTEACPTLGAEGDLILWDPRYYLSVTKREGIRQDVSIHVEFEKDMTAFRFILRVGGQPWHSKAMTRANGSNTLSSIVTLAAR